jgi:hypothetical protein
MQEGMGHRAWGIEHGEIQRIAGRNKRSEIRGQKSGVKLISDLRLLTSVIKGFNSFTFVTTYWV